ncbi:uncharacterized protein [Littorina saxatilis]|uniref:uncharacterized protein n=1 Tax=Littorina saxatilis TaxID=31220 RepID=UPI0038B661FE
MLEEHSVGLLVAIVGSVVVFFFGLIVNLSHITQRYTSSPLIPEILNDGSSNDTSPFQLPVSLAAWSISIWGVVYVCQFFWLAYSLAGICRRTALGPAYNNPKLLPVQVHFFFSLAVLTQVGWLVLMNRHSFIFALLNIVLSTGCSLIALAESYRSLTAVLPIMQQEERFVDLCAIRIFAQNPLALFFVWIMLHAALTLTYFFTFGMETRHVSLRTGSLMDLCTAGFLMFVYVLGDLTIFDKFSRYVVLPYIGFVLFHAAQLNKDWPSTRSPVFVLMAGLTAFTFLCVLVKFVALLCRHLVQREKESKAEVMTRPLVPDLEEETYLLQQN